jgi:hypothetical protein
MVKQHGNLPHEQNPRLSSQRLKTPPCLAAPGTPSLEATPLFQVRGRALRLESCVGENMRCTSMMSAVHGQACTAWLVEPRFRTRPRKVPTSPHQQPPARRQTQPPLAKTRPWCARSCLACGPRPLPQSQYGFARARYARFAVGLQGPRPVGPPLGEELRFDGTGALQHGSVFGGGAAVGGPSRMIGGSGG